MKKFFKSIKDKLRVVFGAVRLALFGDVDGWAESHWETEVRGYEQNIFLNGVPFNKAVFVGDTGMSGPHRDMVVAAIHEYGPRHVFVLGDIGYPVGVGDDFMYQWHIQIPFGHFGKDHLSTDIIEGNHDGYGSRKERTYLARKIGKGLGKVRRPNFYWAQVYTNAIVVAFDSTVYDVIIGDPEIQARQERFVRRVLVDPIFAGLTKIVVCHAGVYSNGDHGNTSSSDYIKFFKDSIANNAHYMVAGHDHIIQEYGEVDGVKIITSGSGSKLLSSDKVKAVPGFATYENGRMTLREVFGSKIFTENS